MKIEENKEKIKDNYKEFKKFLEKNNKNFFGYPESPYMDERGKYIINMFSHIHINNAGDPFEEDGYLKSHSKKYERECINFFGNLFHIENVWGYVTTGGTEGNLQGLYVGRNYLKMMYNQNPILITSKASHYSIKKNADILNLDLKMINVNEKDEMDLDDFELSIKSINIDIPVLININIGTTIKGAIDNFGEIIKILKNKQITKYYIHADMALYGIIYGIYCYKPEFSKYINSFSISGHKLLTTIHPCGVFITKNKIINKVFSDRWIDYIGSSDKTISGSRNGLLTMLIYDKISKGLDSIKIELKECIDNCKYLFDKMQKLNIKCEKNYEESIIIYFPKPSEYICNKYQLACYNNIAHVICMPHIKKRFINKFVDDMNEEKLKYLNI